MLSPYQRRAFLLSALSVLSVSAVPAQAGVASAVAGPDSLWDLLAQTHTAVLPLAATAANTGAKAADATEPSVPARRSLGPVPGFTLPTSKRAEIDSLFGKKQKKSGGLFGSVGDWFNRLESSTGTKIKVTGSHTTSLRLQSISGNSTDYNDQQYYGRGSNGIYNDTDVTVDATLFKHFHYQTRVSNSPFRNAQDNRVKLDYNVSKTRLEWGDINAGFTGNGLIDFNRYLNGTQWTQKWSKQLSTKLLFAQTKAETRSLQITGNNSAGPYYVYAGQIVEGSDHVRVNNKDLIKGTDYTLDTFTGELRFTNGTIVTQNDTITVSFETLGYNQTQGNIYGFRSDFAPNSGMHFGMTYVAQNSKGSGIPQARPETFQGKGAPGDVYTTSASIDVSKPITVTVNNVALVKGVDYVIDTAYTNQVRIVQAVPQIYQVIITYYPLDTSVTPGNRSVLGLDGTFSLGKIGSLTTEAALSGLSVLGTNTQGKAFQIRADLTPFKNVHTNLTLRDINPTFSSIQSPGFNQNEKSVELSGEYTPTKNLRLNMSWQKAKRPSYAYGTTNQFTVASIGNDDYNTYTLGGSYRFARSGTLSLNRSNTSTTFIQGGNSSYLTDSLSLNYGFRSLTFDAALTRSKNLSNSIYTGTTTGNTTVGSGTTLTSYNSSTTSESVGLRWQPVKWLSLSGTTSNNNITSISTGSSSQQTTARDTQLTANLSAIRNLRLAYTYSLSDTGNDALASSTTGSTTGTTGTTVNTRALDTTIGTITRSTAQLAQHTSDILTRDSTAGTGYTSPYNTGAAGNYSGFYGSGLTSGYSVSSFGGKSQGSRLNLDYQPRQNMNVGFMVDYASSIGDYQYNSTRKNVAFTFGWQLSNRLQINTNYNVQSVVYTGSYGSTSSNTLLLSLQGRPFGGKLGVQFNWQGLSTTSNLNFSATTGTTTTTPSTNGDSNMSSLSLRLDYPLSKRYTLFVEMVNSSTIGYLGSKDNDMRLGIDIPLNVALKCSIGWQMTSRIYNDPTNAGGNYKVNSLLAELGFRF